MKQSRRELLGTRIPTLSERPESIVNPRFIKSVSDKEYCRQINLINIGTRLKERCVKTEMSLEEIEDMYPFLVRITGRHGRISLVNPHAIINIYESVDSTRIEFLDGQYWLSQDPFEDLDEALFV